MHKVNKTYHEQDKVRQEFACGDREMYLIPADILYNNLTFRTKKRHPIGDVASTGKGISHTSEIWCSQEVDIKVYISFD
ncbi:hypothetical protein [Porphyromonas sp.]|uniref:hypothetical protein n=1 Tax=Porphyromonas sp. TaxID=1924944 RepID=UPI0026DBD17C|nr:hypothetical protein [Porphyromonas sp.]MDO4695903.1 hypothetical protein [Porphyromonas sp.]MDO4771596.1 hypothetical protein [Porphyromonas sp.]